MYACISGEYSVFIAGFVLYAIVIYVCTCAHTYPSFACRLFVFTSTDHLPDAHVQQGVKTHNTHLMVCYQVLAYA